MSLLVQHAQVLYVCQSTRLGQRCTSPVGTHVPSLNRGHALTRSSCSTIRICSQPLLGLTCPLDLFAGGIEDTATERAKHSPAALAAPWTGLSRRTERYHWALPECWADAPAPAWACRWPVMQRRSRQRRRQQRRRPPGRRGGSRAGSGTRVAAPPLASRPQRAGARRRCSHPRPSTWCAGAARWLAAGGGMGRR